MVIVFLQSYHILGESRCKVRSRSGQWGSNFDIFNLGKQRHVSDAEYPKDSNGAIYFFLYVGQHSKKSCFIVWRHN